MKEEYMEKFAAENIDFFLNQLDGKKPNIFVEFYHYIKFRIQNYIKRRALIKTGDWRGWTKAEETRFAHLGLDMDGDFDPLSRRVVIPAYRLIMTSKGVKQ